LRPILAEAIARLGQQGIDAQLLSMVAFSIDDLPGSILGLARPQAISIDVNAAGHGWFVDTSPHDDREFAEGTVPGSTMDLLSVVMHELGHAAGLADHYDHDHADDLMFGLLQPGTRRGVGSEHIDTEHVPSLQITAMPVMAPVVDLFAVRDAIADVSRYVSPGQSVSSLSGNQLGRATATVSSAAEIGGSDMRQGLGLMTAGDADNRDLSEAAIDQLFLGLLGPDSQFDLNF